MRGGGISDNDIERRADAVIPETLKSLPQQMQEAAREDALRMKPKLEEVLGVLAAIQSRRALSPKERRDKESYLRILQAIEFLECGSGFS